jgi:hypothetical protein
MARACWRVLRLNPTLTLSQGFGLPNLCVYGQFDRFACLFGQLLRFN